MLTVSTNRTTKQVRYLKLWFSWTSLSVTEEGNVCGTLRVPFVVVLRAVSVGQLDHAIIVRKLGVKLAEIPRACATAEMQQKKVSSTHSEILLVQKSCTPQLHVKHQICCDWLRFRCFISYFQWRQNKLVASHLVKQKWPKWTYLWSTWQAPAVSGHCAAFTLPHTLMK